MKSAIAFSPGAPMVLRLSTQVFILIASYMSFSNAGEAALNSLIVSSSSEQFFNAL